MCFQVCGGEKVGMKGVREWGDKDVLCLFAFRANFRLGTDGRQVP